MTARLPRARIDGDSGRRSSIFNSVGASPFGDRFASGFIPGCGTYFCLSCGAQLSLHETDPLPRCASCGGSRFRRDSIFSARQEHEGTTAEHRVPASSAIPGWLETARRSLPGAGNHLVHREDDGQLGICTIERGWTRIGRSEAADLYLDDPTVSRRHALIVAEPGRALEVLDDRSLNGVFVNGRQVELGPLRPGDELAIGRFHLYLLSS